MATAVAEPRAVETEDSAGPAIVGRSPGELAWRRFKRDKVGVVALAISLSFLAVSALAVPIVRLLGLNPYTFNQSAIDPSSQVPIAPFGGISWAHPFGLEPGLGRDIFSRIILGSQWSFSVAFITTFLTLGTGLVIGVTTGYLGGVVDSAVGRIIDFMMAFPGFFMIIALSEPTVQRMESFPFIQHLYEGKGLQAKYLSIGIGALLGIAAVVFALGVMKHNRPRTIIGAALTAFMAFGFITTFSLQDPWFSTSHVRVFALVAFLAFFGWLYFARLIRSQVLSMRERDFVTAARALGAPDRRIVFKELIPNLWPPVIVFASNALPGYLSAEAAFSYLGIGVQQPESTWGTILEQSQQFWQSDPVFFIIPGALLFVVVLAFNLVGDAVRDALDPKLDR
ncbi:MAG: ABC transporter permease [Actinomycetales bacterium]|nr:ABC transporter permease [Actinomycetales bacterium]